jgi:hypothetical protein
MMSEQDRVKKAIADGGIETIRPSVEDLERYSGIKIVANAGIPRVDYRITSRSSELTRRILGDFGSPLPRVPLDMFPDRIFGDFSSVASNVAPSEYHDTLSAILRRREMAEHMPYDSYMSFDAGIPPQERLDTSTAVLEPPPEMPRPSKDILARYQITDSNVTDMRAELAVEAETLLGYNVLRKRLGIHSPLTEALLKLEIEPFDTATVNQYKKQMLAYAQNEAARMDVAEGIKPGTWRARVANWQSEPIEEYRKPIPEFAIDTALRIKKAMPEIEFRIEELTIVPDPFLIAVLGRVQRYVEVWDEPKFEER